MDFFNQSLRAVNTIFFFFFTPILAGGSKTVTWTWTRSQSQCNSHEYARCIFARAKRRTRQRHCHHKRIGNALHFAYRWRISHNDFLIDFLRSQIVWLTEWKYRYYMDPALSIVLVILMLNSVWPLLRESALILLQTVPTHIQVVLESSVCALVHWKLSCRYWFSPQIRWTQYRSDWWRRWTVCWPYTNSMCGNWLAIESLHRHTFDAEIFPNTWKLPKKLKNFSTMRASIRPPFSPNFWSWRIWTVFQVYLGAFTLCE